jgi:hypothetical protein
MVNIEKICLYVISYPLVAKGCHKSRDTLTLNIPVPWSSPIPLQTCINFVHKRIHLSNNCFKLGCGVGVGGGVKGLARYGFTFSLICCLYSHSNPIAMDIKKYAHLPSMFDFFFTFSVNRGLHPAHRDERGVRRLRPLVLLPHRAQGLSGLRAPFHTGHSFTWEIGG